jgi:hypothetical protein
MVVLLMGALMLLFIRGMQDAPPLTTQLLVAKLRHLLAGNRLDQELNTVKVEFDTHAEATEFFDTLVEVGEPAADATIDEVTSV